MWLLAQMLRSATLLLPWLLLALRASPQAPEPPACAPPATAQPGPADLSASPGRSQPGPAEQHTARAAAAGPMEIPPSHFPASRAAAVVGNYVNFQHGGPNKIFAVRKVSRASREDIAGVGHKYRLQFSMAEILQKESLMNCTAEILYHQGDQHVAPEVHYTVEGEFGKNTEQVDNEFYSRIKNLSETLEAQNIPDNHGNMTAEMEPVRNLAQVACGYVIWQNSTEDTLYNMIQVESVKQVVKEIINAHKNPHLKILSHPICYDLGCTAKHQMLPLAW
ncbi:latexin isoform X2 [Sphaerodactylus townsendi]|uniref:latexin isoform X2 n=1 Tax=Sphaerodactylus townsendi TaxID=933632 RepID=UPI0020269BE5|nr:latexin isoform X2 [Sphaerodactylus townsendi]